MAGQTAQKLFDVFFAIPARLGTICATPTLAVLFRDSVSRVLSQFPSPFPSLSFAHHHLQYFPSPPPCKPLVSRNNNAQRVTKIFRFRATGNGSHVRLFRAPFSSFDITRVGSWIVHLFLLFLMRDRIGNFYRKKCNWECRITYFNL